MNQLELFEIERNERRVLLRDIEGGVIYTPGYLRQAQTRTWFEQLKAEVPWQQDRRPVYDREVAVARYSATWRLDERMPMPEPLVKIASLLFETTGVRFNVATAYLYRNGKDCASAADQDRTQELVPGHPIAVLPFGATRQLCVKPKQPPRRVQQVDLYAGSLLLISHQALLHHDVTVPKQRDVTQPHIALHYRLRRRG